MLTVQQSANDLDSHDRWVSDINELYNTNLQFPIIADADRSIAFQYGMVDQRDIDSLDIVFTIRSVFVIDPAKKIRLTVRKVQEEQVHVSLNLGMSQTASGLSRSLQPRIVPGRNFGFKPRLRHRRSFYFVTRNMLTYSILR